MTIGTENEIKEIHLIIKRGPFDRPRQLIISPDFIQFEDKDLRSDLFTRFKKSEIKDFRFGIRWIQGLEFTIGREYTIYIRNNDNRIIKLNFKSHYGIKKKEYHVLYGQILDSLWNFYFCDIANNYMVKFLDDEEFSIGEVNFTKEYLKIKVGGIVRDDSKEIPWDMVRTRDYQTYFAIYSQDDPASINRGYSYLDDWNSGILSSVVQAIINNKKEESGIV